MGKRRKGERKEKRIKEEKSWPLQTPEELTKELEFEQERNKDENLDKYFVTYWIVAEDTRRDRNHQKITG